MIVLRIVAPADVASTTSDFGLDKAQGNLFDEKIYLPLLAQSVGKPRVGSTAFGKPSKSLPWIEKP